MPNYSYSLAAATALLLFFIGNNDEGARDNNSPSRHLFCHAFINNNRHHRHQGIISSDISDSSSDVVSLHQLPIRKSGIIGITSTSTTSVNSTDGVNAISVIQKHHHHDTTNNNVNNNKQRLQGSVSNKAKNEKMKQDHNGALLWTTRKKIHPKNNNNSNNNNDDGDDNNYHSSMLQDESDVDHVASMLMEEPPNIFTTIDDNNIVLNADNRQQQHVNSFKFVVNNNNNDGNNEHSKYGKQQQESAALMASSLSLSEKRERIKANAHNNVSTDGGRSAVIEKSSSTTASSPMSSFISTVDTANAAIVTPTTTHHHAPSEQQKQQQQYENNKMVHNDSSHEDVMSDNDDNDEAMSNEVVVTMDNSSIGTTAATATDAALLIDADSMLEIINETEAQLDFIVDDEEEEEEEVGAQNDDDDIAMGDNEVAHDEEEEESTPDEVVMANHDDDSPPLIATPLSLNSMVEGITTILTSSFAPLQSQSNHNSNEDNNPSSIENLSEINAQLEKILVNKKFDLGRLRKRINELQGELRRANREARKNVDDQVSAKMGPLREECNRQVIEANAAVTLLEEQVETLSRDLAEQSARYEQTLEDKERIAAEYGYVAKSYVELKRSLDTNTNDWQKKLQKLTGDTQSLEEKMVQYQQESTRWKKKCIEKAKRLDESTAHIKELQGVMDASLSEIRSKQENIDDIVRAATNEEKTRSKEDLQRLSDEYEVLLSNKSQKIGKLRTALRTANVKRRSVERNAHREKSAALKALRLEMTTEINSLKNSLQEKEDLIMTMSKSVQNAEVVKEEKERVYAELMFLSKSFKELQLSLETSKQNYEERICKYEEEAAMKEQLILDLRRDLEVAEEKIRTLESQVADLSAELVEERRKNEELTSVVSSLTSELDVMRSNADGFDDIITILRSEKESYERQLSDERDSTSSLKKKRADLEDLISKTRYSLVLEKERVANDMNERDNRIAQIDSDLAEQKIENESLKQSLKQTTDRYNSEKARVERLNAQLDTARRNLPLTNADHDDELETLTNRISELSSSKDELGSMLSKTESKLGLMTQQLLLSNQHISNKQSEIARLKEELSTTVASTAADSSKDSLHDNLSALTVEMEDLKSSARKEKAKANEKIILVNQKLEEKDAEVMKLQNKVEELMRINNADNDIKPAADNEELSGLKASIETLQTSLKDAQMKQKEKIQLKNQSLKEKEDTIERLQADMMDLQSEKERLSKKLNEQVKRREDECRSHELQLKSTEDRLTKENLAAINALEEEMNETIHQLELEVELLKKKVADEDLIGSTATIAQAKRMHDLENALRLSKEKEVSLLSENMKIKHRLDNLQFVQAKASKETVASFPVKSVGEERQKDVPAYFKEKQRPLVIRVVGNAWKKVFSRKKKLL